MRNMVIQIPFEIDPSHALNILCQVLDIENVVKTDEPLYIIKGKVCRKDSNGKYIVVDDRADLFAAIRNVANAMFPNLDFRSDPYITHYADSEITVTD